MSPQDSTFIGKKHLVEARRHGHKDEHVPSLKTLPKNNAKEFNKQQCSNSQCNNVEYDKLIAPMFMTNDQITELYGIEYTDEPFVLCRKCYNETYATFYGSHGIPCSSCGAKPKKGTAFSRHSPDAEKISQRLSKQTGQNIIINPDDYLCSKFIASP